MNRGKNEHIHELQQEIGQQIAEKRISMGLSLAEVEAKTKISQSFIEDIEKGNFEHLPGKLFGRGFIKNICLFLELDTQSILETYEKSWIYTPEIVKERNKVRHFSFFLRQKGSKLSFAPSIFRHMSMNRLVFYMFVPVVLIVSVFCIRYLSQKAVEPELSQSKTSSNTNDIVEDSAPVPVAIPLLDTAQSAKPSTNYVLAPKEELKATDLNLSKKEETAIVDTKPTVTITVKEDVKIKHRILPDDYTYSTFTPGVYRFPFDEQIDFVLSDASAVDVMFNGKGLGVLGKKGEEKQLSFSSKDLSQDLTPKNDAKM